MQSVKDTTILGKPARMLAAARYLRNSANNVVSGRQDTFYVYNTEDTVFAYDKVISDFTPLYVFNVTVGDTVCLRQPNATLPASISPGFCIIIDSIKLEDYGGVQLLSYYNHTIITDDADFALNWGVRKLRLDTSKTIWRSIGKYTKTIGGNWPRSGSFFPDLTYFNADYYKDIGFPTGTFRCYTDAATNIKMLPGEACDSINRVPISVPKLAGSSYQVSLFPNPSSGRFSLTVQKPLKEAMDLQVADLSGRIMHSSLWPAGKTALGLDLRQLNSGTYLLLLQAKGQRYYQKLVISR